MSTSMRLLVAIVTVLVLVFVRMIVVGESVWGGIDDAAITYTYAHNIVQGYGYVHYPGGPWVEGSTSPLWLCLTIVATAVAGSSVHVVMMVFSCVLLICTMLLMMSMMERLGVSSLTSVVMSCSYATLPYVVDWTVLSGLETGLWVFTILRCIDVFTKPTSVAVRSIWLAVLITTRPEGMMISFILIAVDWYHHRQHRTSLKVLIVSALLLMTMIGIRLSMFGVPLPNTFYAKVSLSPIENVVAGLEYIARAIFQTSILPWLLGGFAILRYYSAIPKLYWIIAILVVAIAVAAGGDHFPGGRFLLPTVAVLWIQTGRVVDALPLRARTAFLVFVVLMIQIPLRIFVDHSTDRQLQVFRSGLTSEFVIAEGGRQDVRRLMKVLGDSPRPTLALIAAGGRGQVYDGPTFDLLGLNDPEMARSVRVKNAVKKNHGSFITEVFYRRLPDIMYVLPPLEGHEQRTWQRAVCDSSQSFDNEILQGLLVSTRFRSLYAMAALVRGNDSVTAVVRRDISRLLPESITVRFVDSTGWFPVSP